MNCQPPPAIAQLQVHVERLERAGYSDAASIHFARAILGERTRASSCAACQAALPEYIETELNNRPGPYYRVIRHHLDLCPACADTYLNLLETALLAEEGVLPWPSVTVDLSFLDQPTGRSSSDV